MHDGVHKYFNRQLDSGPGSLFKSLSGSFLLIVTVSQKSNFLLSGTCFVSLMSLGVIISEIIGEVVDENTEEQSSQVTVLRNT